MGSDPSARKRRVMLMGLAGQTLLGIAAGAAASSGGEASAMAKAKAADSWSCACYAAVTDVATCGKAGSNWTSAKDESGSTDACKGKCDKTDPATDGVAQCNKV